MSELSKIHKQAAIVADAYKVERYKQELTDEGFIFEVHTLKSGIKMITVTHLEDQLYKINEICLSLEKEFRENKKP